MEKLYKKIRGKLHYHEAWEETRGYTEHWGVVGEPGESREVKAPKGVRPEAALDKALEAPRAAGYAPIDEDRHAILMIEYATGKDPKRDLKKRHALEDWLNDKLGWTGLGHCDGGSIGSGTMEACCLVVDYALAKRVLERELAATEFADFARIYKEAVEKAQPPARKKSVYAPGDCLAVRLGKVYGAAYVAASEAEGGTHVVVELDYLEAEKPGLQAFGALKPLIVSHDKWDNVLNTKVTPRRTKALDAWIEVVGNRRLNLPGVDIAFVNGSWVNWKEKIRKDIAAMLDANDFKQDPAAGRYVSTTGDWGGFHIVFQRKWDARKKR